MNTTAPIAALKALEAALVEIGPELQTAEPRQYARAQQLVAALRAGTSRAQEVQTLSVELLRWQLELRKRRYEGQLAALAALIEQRVPAALAAEKAVRAAISLLERSLEIATSPHRARSGAELASFQKLARELEQAATAAADALRRSTPSVPLHAVHTQPTAPGGATLRPAPPRAKNLASFRLRPGAIPAAAPRSTQR